MTGATHHLTRYLRTLILAKRSTLCVSADVTSAAEMLSLAHAVGPSIVVFKTHADIHAGWDADPQHGTGAQLAAIARRHRFLIFEDRKFADIGFTAQLQYAAGDYRIVEWAHITNAHVVSGPDMVRALSLTAAAWTERQPEGDAEREPCPAVDIEPPPAERALLLLAQMSSADNLLDAKYTAACASIARRFQGFVMGFIALGPLDAAPGDDFVVMTPGCALPPHESLDQSEFPGGDALGQQYVTPQELMSRGCDVIIVGTGICNAADPVAKAEQYRKAAWDAYRERLSV
ncbi:putative orotidine 5 -phosphate decarboxylase protein [Neofusicoccum parvum UCRNP2]|uniref:Orotidine 5'-phosphate decarboxylase n=1 Tax=Botryosphaeria parva (strain UCR-NP2) TaxID=1287680 RepID=R1EJF6_BOTPV|nr:putative orotidine 5 -phosphate decarboxylase protein [Neofusicoccum parvum UCRNP2]